MKRKKAEMQELSMTKVGETLVEARRSRHPKNGTTPPKSDIKQFGRKNYKEKQAQTNKGDGGYIC